jgi:nuclear cap-binding protein subunit 1
MAALHELRASEWQAPAVLPRPSESAVIPEGATMPEPYAISPVYMPPEMYDVDEENPQDCEGRTGGLVLFNEGVVPPTNTMLGWTLRSLLLDTLNIFEVNRKECARFLLTISRYLAPGTFKSEESESTYSLESSVVSVILSTLCTLPNAPHRPLFYGSVITELCKLSPSTIAPPVGRAVRKIFTQLGEDGLDVEVSRRISDWFAIHLSNFGFQSSRRSASHTTTASSRRSRTPCSRRTPRSSTQKRPTRCGSTRPRTAPFTGRRSTSSGA